MYVGPWQEFMLYKILLLKEKLQKEEEAKQKAGGPNPENLAALNSQIPSTENKYNGLKEIDKYLAQGKGGVHIGQHIKKSIYSDQTSTRNSISSSQKNSFINKKPINTLSNRPRGMAGSKLPNHRGVRKIGTLGSVKGSPLLTSDSPFGSGLNDSFGSIQSFQSTQTALQGKPYMIPKSINSFRTDNGSPGLESVSTPIDQGLPPKSHKSKSSRMPPTKVLRNNYKKWHNVEEALHMVDKMQQKEILSKFEPPRLDRLLSQEALSMVQKKQAQRPPKPIIRKRPDAMSHKERISKMKELYKIKSKSSSQPPNRVSVSESGANKDIQDSSLLPTPIYTPLPPISSPIRSPIKDIDNGNYKAYNVQSYRHPLENKLSSHNTRGTLPSIQNRGDREIKEEIPLPLSNSDSGGIRISLDENSLDGLLKWADNLHEDPIHQI